MDNKSANILVAEDDIVTRMVISSVLKQNGYIVQAAENGKKALEIFSTKSEIDIIVTDLNMPEMNGLELIKEIRNRGSEIPIIILSGNEDISVAINALKSGANDYILKEKYAQEALIPTVENFLEKEQLKLRNRQLTEDLIEKNAELELKNVRLLETSKQLDETLQRLKEELSEAAQYVKKLLPEPIDSPCINADWRFIPSTSLGGDSLGYHWLDDDHFAIYLLDVTGHGVGSALLSVTVMNVLRSDTFLNIDFRKPGDVLYALNNAFQMEKHNNLFFSIWYGVYNKKDHLIKYSEGGHPPGLLYNNYNSSNNKHEIIQLHTHPNPIIGVMEEIPYEEKIIKLENYSKLYIFSDGVFEINKKDDTIWTFEEFEEFMAENTNSKKPLMDELYDYTKQMCKTESFDDDFSILEISFKNH